MHTSDRVSSPETGSGDGPPGRGSSWRLPLLVTLVACLVCALFLAAFLSRFGYHVSALIGVGDQTMARFDFGDDIAPGVVIWRDSEGYDGQYYYLVARDPLLRAGVFPDAFRRQRILYPLGAAVLALGQADFLPYSMLALNLLALGACTFLVAYLIQPPPGLRRGRATLGPWWALLGGLGAGNLGSVQNDLPDVLALALSLLALVLYRQRRVGRAAGVLAVALLAKESAVLFLTAFLLLELGRRRPRPATLLAASALPYLGYQALLFLGTGDLGLLSSSGKGNLALPLLGIIGGAAHWRLSPWTELARSAGSILALGVVVLAVVSVAPLLWRLLLAHRGEHKVRPHVGQGARRAPLRPLPLGEGREPVLHAGKDEGAPSDLALYTVLLAVQAAFALVAGSAIWEGYTSIARLLIAVVPLAVLLYLEAVRQDRASLALRGLVLACLLLSALTLVRPLLVTPAIPSYIK